MSYLPGANHLSAALPFWLCSHGNISYTGPFCLNLLLVICEIAFRMSGFRFYGAQLDHPFCNFAFKDSLDFRLATNRMARAIGQASCTLSCLDNDLHGPGFRTSKILHVSLALMLYTPRLAVTVGMGKGQCLPRSI